MPKPLPTFMLRYERLVNEDLLRVAQLLETDERTYFDLAAGHFQAFAQRVPDFRPEPPWLGRGRCPACQRLGFSCQIEAGRWICLTCETDGTVRDLERFPIIGSHGLGKAIAKSKASGWAAVAGEGA